MSGKFIVVKKKWIVKIFLFLGMLSIIGVIGVNKVNHIVETAGKSRLLPIYSVETDKKEVVLTFDCAWGADDIPSIIETLAKNNVKATFFTVGDWVTKNPEAVKKLSESGMEIR